MSLPRTTVLIIVALLLQACSTVPDNYQLTDEQAEDAVHNWLFCDECSDHQLHHVVNAGDHAEGVLAKLKAEPELAVPSDLEGRLDAQYDYLVRAIPAITISKTAYVNVHLSSVTNRIKARAAVALRIMNPSEVGRAELEEIRRVR